MALVCKLRRILAAALGVALLALVALPDPGAAQIYHWVDDSGRTHYTDNIHDVPPRYRRDAEDIQDDLRKEILSHQPDPAAAAAAPSMVPEPAPQALEPDSAAAFQTLLEEGGAAKALGALGAGMLAALGAGFVLALLLIAAFGSLFLILACRICKTDPPGFGKGMGIALVQMVANLAVSVLAVLLLGVQSAGATSFQGASFGLSFLVYAGVLHAMHGTSFGTSLLVSIIAMLLTFAVSIGMVFLALCAGGMAAVAS